MRLSTPKLVAALPYPIQQGGEAVQGYPTEHGTVYLGPIRIR